MVVDCAPNVPQFKQKRSYRSDYFCLKPDKAVPKAVPKVVLWNYILLYLLFFNGDLREILVPRRGHRTFHILIKLQILILDRKY